MLRPLLLAPALVLFAFLPAVPPPPLAALLFIPVAASLLPPPPLLAAPLHGDGALPPLLPGRRGGGAGVWNSAYAEYMSVAPPAMLKWCA